MENAGAITYGKPLGKYCRLMTAITAYLHVKERENLFAKSNNKIAYNGRLPGEHMPIYAGRL